MTAILILPFALAGLSIRAASPVEDGECSSMMQMLAIAKDVVSHNASAMITPGTPDSEAAMAMRSEPGQTTCALPSFAQWCTVDAGGDDQKFVMAVYAQDDIVSNSICSQGMWEINDVRHIGSPGTALDIGGNVGYYSFLLASAGWRVETFEPLPTNLQLLNATACRNPELAKKVSIHPIGLGSHDDSCVLVSGKSNIGDAVASCGQAAEDIRSGKLSKDYEIRGSFPIRRLDDVLMEKGISTIDFVKIDVEGFECQVFKAGSTLLSKFRPKYIQSEVWPTLQNCSRTDYLGMFTNASYKVAKTPDCKTPDSSLSADIDEFYMCRNTSVFLQLS